MCLVVCVLHKAHLNLGYICRRFRGRERRWRGAGGPLTRICLSAPTFAAWRMNAERWISITLMRFDSSLALHGNSVRGKASVSHWSLSCECYRAPRVTYVCSALFEASVLVADSEVLLKPEVKLFAAALYPLLVNIVSAFSEHFFT